MTCDIQDRSIGDVLELLIEQGLDGTAEAISILLNEAMRLEREDTLELALGSALKSVKGMPMATRRKHFRVVLESLI